MTTTAVDQFGIQEALQQLGLKEINEGASTGKNWFSNGKIIESYSPATGELIGKVKSATKEDYEKADERSRRSVQNLAFRSGSETR